MKKIIVILIIISSSISQIFAQVGKIEGKLISASGNAGIAFATVKFSNENGVFTDENGEFQIEDLPLGTYNLVVTCIGSKVYSICMSNIIMKSAHRTIRRDKRHDIINKIDRIRVAV